MLEQVELTQEQAVLLAPFLRLLISTFLLVVAILILRAVSARFIRKNVSTPDLRAKWLVQSRNAFILLLMLGLVLIWGEELRTLALSVVAIAGSWRANISCEQPAPRPCCKCWLDQLDC